MTTKGTQTLGKWDCQTYVGEEKKPKRYCLMQGHLTDLVWAFESV